MSEYYRRADTPFTTALCKKTDTTLIPSNLSRSWECNSERGDKTVIQMAIVRVISGTGRERFTERCCERLVQRFSDRLSGGLQGQSIRERDTERGQATTGIREKKKSTHTGRRKPSRSQKVEQKNKKEKQYEHIRSEKLNVKTERAREK